MKEVFADGTFSIAPGLFSQIYVILSRFFYYIINNVKLKKGGEIGSFLFYIAFSVTRARLLMSACGRSSPICGPILNQRQSP